MSASGQVQMFVLGVVKAVLLSPLGAWEIGHATSKSGRILRERYADSGPTLAAENLAERHQIMLAKEPVRRAELHHAHDAHRALRSDEELELIFAWRELRKVTHSLTLRYERQIYLAAL